LESDATKHKPLLTREEELNLSVMLYRKAFAHIGPRVLGDQMALSHIDRAVLLPVLHPESEGDEEMDLINTVYGGDKRLILGYCVPNKVANHEIKKHILSAVARYNTQLVKIHPNITGINLSAAAGRERIAAIFSACSEIRLPVVIHGGISPVIKNPELKDYASLKNLAAFDWKAVDFPVVISHAGMMGAGLHEIQNELLSVLKTILSSNERVLIDISGLDLSALKFILANIETERIVFGSDFYYFSQWGSIVKLLYAIKSIFRNFEEIFLQVVSSNSAKYFFLSKGIFDV
jgi:lipid-A-disaccharide synthase-like uncharacterized protein